MQLLGAATCMQSAAGCLSLECATPCSVIQLPLPLLSPLLPAAVTAAAAAALSENLSADAPLGVDILGSRVVLFREGDSIKCLDDTCPHRCVCKGGEVLMPTHCDGRGPVHGVAGSMRYGPELPTFWMMGACSG